jgi:hypothetical protein
VKAQCTDDALTFQASIRQEVIVRFIVTSIGADEPAAARFYEYDCRGRGEMENRIEEQQLYLFANRTGCETMRTGKNS